MKNILILTALITFTNQSFAMKAHPQNGTTMLQMAEKYQGIVTSCSLSEDDVESLETLISQSNSYDFCYQVELKKQFLIDENIVCVSIEKVFKPRRKANQQIATCS